MGTHTHTKCEIEQLKSIKLAARMETCVSFSFRSFFSNIFRPGVIFAFQEILRPSLASPIQSHRQKLTQNRHQKKKEKRKKKERERENRRRKKKEERRDPPEIPE